MASKRALTAAFDAREFAASAPYAYGFYFYGFRYAG
jgi:hypothetical protein